VGVGSGPVPKSAVHLLVTTFTKVALELKDSVPHRLPEVHVEAMQPEITAQQREGVGTCHTRKNCR
jgi:hypothetical protein